MNGNFNRSEQDRNVASSNAKHISNGARNYRENDNRHSRNIENVQPNKRGGRRGTKRFFNNERAFIIGNNQ